MLAEAVKGATRPAQRITWTREEGTPEPLTGATLTGKLRNQDTREVRAVAGALTVIDGPQGTFEWSYVDADVAEAGVFDVQFTATFVASPSPARTTATQWVVAESFS